MQYDYFPLVLSFLPAYFLLSVTPGLSMLMAMNIGAAHGVMRASLFVFGAAFGVAVVAISSITGVVALMSTMPVVFDVIKYAGAAFLIYIGYTFLTDSGEVSNEAGPVAEVGGKGKIVFKGFLTAILNPKGWLFFAAFLPVFIVGDLPLSSQIIIIVFIVMAVEAFCMVLYAAGGDQVGKLIKNRSGVRVLNVINALVMFALSILLILK